MDSQALHHAAHISDPVERARVLTQLITQDRGFATEAARYRRQAIAEARASGISVEQLAAALGVTPGRVSQITHSSGQAAVQAPESSATKAPRVLVQRALPTDPAVRGSVSLHLVEAERQGVRGDRRMLYVGHEAANDHVAACLRVEPGDDVIARRKVMLANDTPVRIATSFFRADLFADTRMALPEFVRPSLQSALADLGYRFGRADETLTARRATTFERSTLELDYDEWIVQVIRASYSSEDTPIHVLETICAATRHIFPIGQVAGSDEF